MAANTGFLGNRELKPARGRDTSKPLPPVTEVGIEGHLEPAADQDRGPGAVAISATSDQPGALSQPGEAEQGSPDARRGAGEVSGTAAAMLWAPPTAAQGELEPEARRDQPGMAQPCGQEEQPETGEERAAEPPQWAQGFSGGGESPTCSKGGQLAEGGRNAEEGEVELRAGPPSLRGNGFC